MRFHHEPQHTTHKYEPGTCNALLSIVLCGILHLPTLFIGAYPASLHFIGTGILPYDAQ